MAERLFLNHSFVHNDKKILKSAIEGYDVLEGRGTESIVGFDIETGKSLEIENSIYGTSDELATKDLIEIMAEVIGRLAARIRYIEKKLEIKPGDAEHEEFLERLELQRKQNEESSKQMSSFVKHYAKYYQDKKEQRQNEQQL